MLKSELKYQKVRLWLDKDRIESGMYLDDEFRDNVKNAGVFILHLTDVCFNEHRAFSCCDEIETDPRLENRSNSEE